MPVTEACYIDTSALLKRYVPERKSDEFDAYFVELAPATISRLTLLELRSALGRKRREGAISAERMQAAVSEVRSDIQDGLLRIQPGTDQHLVDAFHVIDQLPDIPLRSLDAMHLAIARGTGATELATADIVMTRAAERLGMRTVFFGN